MTRTTHASGNNKENFSIAKKKKKKNTSEWGEEDEKLFFD
jgi:hypothetical protein